MSVMTVLGPIEVSDLGITLPHEHLLLDLRNQFTEFADPEKARISRERISLTNYGALRRNPYALIDNLVIDDLDLAVEEVREFKKLGGATIVDCTSIGISRDPRRLREIALRTGINIIAGSGYYTADTHPAEMSEWPVEKIADDIISDLTSGIDGTDIKAGVIGEIGTSDPIHPNETKCLMASAIAFNATRVPVQVHTYPWGKTGSEAADLLAEKGVDPRKTVICHTDVEPDIDYMLSLLERGVFIQFDDFGKEFEMDRADRGFAGGTFARDIDRVRIIKKLIDLGYERQILITNDICLKSMLHRYGGWGYDHILRHIVPMMLEEGIGQAAIDTILCGNPKELFSQ